jgi:4-hydroxybenzoate polyprenyltransferase
MLFNWLSLPKYMSTVKNYLSLIKFSHTIFAMPFAFIGFFLALVKPFQNSNGWHFNTNIGTAVSDYNFSNDSLWYKIVNDNHPYQSIAITLGLVVCCMIFARSAAMAFNRWLDAKYDKLNPRTAVREIPSGIITSKNALLFVIVCSLLFMTCTFFINRLCFYLSPVAIFVILFYSYTKRFTALCHLVLGVALGLAPVGAYIAVTGKFSLLPILFSFTVLCWVSGFDIIYALQDEEFDRRQQLHSIPASVGKQKALRISEMLHLAAAAFIIAIGLYGNFGGWYWTGAVLFIALLIYQHTLVKPDNLSKVNLAFFTTNGIASVMFSLFVIADLYLTK